MKSYEYYQSQFVEGAMDTVGVDYSDKKSVSKNNRGVLKSRKAAQNIQAYYPEQVETFSQLLMHPVPEVSVSCAHALIDDMHCSPQVQAKAFQLLFDYAAGKIGDSRLEKPLLLYWLEDRTNVPLYIYDFSSNGVIVQAIEDPYAEHSHCSSDDTPQHTYQGLANYTSWPLQNMKDPLSAELTELLEASWVRPHFDEYAIRTITEKELLQAYVHHCCTLGIRVRLVEIQSNVVLPYSFIQIPKVNKRFIGYEYVRLTDRQQVQSPIFQGNDISDHDEFFQYKQNLNSYGLFEDINDLDDCLHNNAELLNYIAKTKLSPVSRVVKLYLVDI